MSAPVSQPLGNSRGVWGNKCFTLAKGASYQNPIGFSSLPPSILHRSAARNHPSEQRAERLKRHELIRFLLRPDKHGKESTHCASIEENLGNRKLRNWSQRDFGPQDGISGIAEWEGKGGMTSAIGRLTDITAFFSYCNARPWGAPAQQLRKCSVSHGGRATRTMYLRVCRVTSNNLWLKRSSR